MNTPLRCDPFDDEPSSYVTRRADSFATSATTGSLKSSAVPNLDELCGKQKLEVLGQLAGGIVHDMNNVFFVLDACIEELLAGLRPGDPLGAVAEEMKAAQLRGKMLTRDLLRFARNGPRSRDEDVDLHVLILEVSRTVGRLLGDDVELVTNIDPEAEEVMVPRHRWSSILLNLAMNAHHAMPNGGRLTLRTKSHRVGGELRWTVLEVEDTGAGFGPEIGARIFEPFFTTKGPEQGTGLGLAIVKQIVEESGGAIGALSHPGVGSTFRIVLPSTNSAETVPTK